MVWKVSIIACINAYKILQNNACHATKLSWTLVGVRIPPPFDGGSYYPYDDDDRVTDTDEEHDAANSHRGLQPGYRF